MIKVKEFIKNIIKNFNFTHQELMPRDLRDVIKDRRF